MIGWIPGTRIVTTQFDRDNAEYFARIREQTREAREQFEKAQAQRRLDNEARFAQTNALMRAVRHLTIGVKK